MATADVDYLEAHGTGTSLGDPIEVQAAAAVLGQGRDAGRPLLIGSAKTNIGHWRPPPGIAGVLQGRAYLEHQEIPKHLNFRNPSPHIPWGPHPGPRRRRVRGLGAHRPAPIAGGELVRPAPTPT